MANIIEKVIENNPYGVSDVCSHINVDETATLVISDWMPYITNYTFQFWCRAKKNTTVRFSCSNTVENFEIKTTWNHYVVTFTAKQLDDIKLELQNGEYWFYNTKAERGTTPTDWSSNSNDNISNYDDKITGIEESIINMASFISDVESKVDKAEKTITNKVEQTDYEAEVNGIQRDIDKINNGYNKWYLSVYSLDDFEEKDKYDITIFDSAKQNDDGLIDINVYDELMVPDSSFGTLSSIATDNRILYYVTYANFNQDTTLPLSFSHAKCTLYLNGVPVISSSVSETTNIILEFKKGWNLLEIICNESAFTFDKNISENEHCEIFNCLMAVPTSRSIKSRRQYSYLNLYIDRIEASVGETKQELIQDIDGKVTVVNDTIQTIFNQTKDMFSWIVEDGASQSQLTLTSTALEAITDQLIIKSPNYDDPNTPDDERTTVISNGEINTNSITTKMLKSDSIQSQNYNFGYNNKIRIHFDPSSNSILNIDYLKIYYMDDDDNVFWCQRTGPIDVGSWSDVIIPSQKFWMYWHTSSFNESHTGFVIDKIDIESDVQETLFFGPIGQGESNIPKYNERIILNKGTFPILEEYKSNQDIVWECDYSNIKSFTIITKNHPFSKSGTFLDLVNGNFTSPSFTIDTQNNIAYFSGIINSNEAQLGPWTLNGTSLWKGSEILGTSGNSNIYLGNDGFSLGDNFIYNSNNGMINMKTSYLSIDGNEFDSAVSNLASGVKLYHSNGIPTSINYPANSWNDEYSIHNGDVCIDDQTKKIYQFKYIKDNNTPDRVVIKFSSQSGTPTTETGKDYVQIFYKYKGLIHRCPDNSNPFAYTGNALKNLEVVIPSTEFWLYWHSNQDNPSSFTEKGFVIENIYGVSRDIELTQYEVFNINLPSMSGLINRTLPDGSYPALDYYSNNQDILWKCKPFLLNDTIEWNEVNGYDKTYAMRRINYIDYDAEDGIIVHDGSYIDNQHIDGGNVRLKNDGLHIYNGQREYASYGSTTYLYGYKDNGSRFTGAQIDANGFIIGSVTGEYLMWDGNNLRMNVQSLNIGGDNLSDIITDNSNSIWYGTVQPTTNNYPYNNWSSDETEIKKHIDDLYFNTTNGYAYRLQQANVSVIPGITIYFDADFVNEDDYIRIYRKRGSHYYVREFRKSIYAQDQLDEVFVNTDSYMILFHTGSSNTGSRFRVTSVESSYQSTEWWESSWDYYDSEPPTPNVTLYGTSSLPESNYPYEDNMDYVWKHETGLPIIHGVYGWEQITKDVPGQAVLNYMFFNAYDGLVLHYDGGGINHADEINGSSVRITGDDVSIYRGDKKLASYGEGISFYGYKDDNTFFTAASINQNGIVICEGSIKLGKTLFNDDSSGFFVDSDGKMHVGSQNEYIQWDGSKIVVKTKSLEWTSTYSSMTSTGVLTCKNGTIGNIHIAENSIYSGSHNSVDNDNKGFFLGSDGSFSIGNNTKYIKWYTTGTLNMNVSSLNLTANATNGNNIISVINSGTATINAARLTINVSDITINASQVKIGNTTVDAKLSDSSIVSTVTSSNDWSTLSQTANSVTLKVSKNDVINQINLSKEAIKIDGSKLKITSSSEITADVKTDIRVTAGGTLVWSATNSGLSEDGTFWCNNATLSGTITAENGSIGGWTIGRSSISRNNIILKDGQIILQGGTFGTSDTAKITNKGQIIGTSVSCNTCYIGGNGLFEGVIDYGLIVNGDGLYLNVGDRPASTSNRNLLVKTDTVSDVSFMKVFYLASSSLRYKDIDRVLTDEDIKPFYNLNAKMAKYKKGYLCDDDELEGIYFPMLIAEDVNDVCKAAAEHNKNGTVEDWRYRVLIPVHQQMLVSQHNQINNLKEEISSLKQEIQLLKKSNNATSYFVE